MVRHLSTAVRFAETRRLLFLLLTVFLVTAGPQAFANLQGANATLYYDDDGHNIITVGSGSVGAGGLGINFSAVNEDFTITPTDLTMSTETGSSIFGSTSFLGYNYEFSGGSPITSATLISTNIPGFDISRVTFSANQVLVNLQGLGVPTGTNFDIRLFAAPEPSSLVLLNFGVGALWRPIRRKLRR